MKQPLSIEDVLEAMYVAVMKHVSADGRFSCDKKKLIAHWRRLIRRTAPARHLAVLHLGNSHYMCESESRPGQVHALEVHDNEIRCTCENFQLSKNPICKHVQLIARLREEGTLP